MEIIEKIKTNKSNDNLTEIQKICLHKLQSSPLPNPKSELWRLSNKSKLSNSLEPEERSQSGIFLGFQYPIEIPGVSNLEFLRVSTNARRKFLNKEELDTFDFEELVKEKLEIVKMDHAFLSRSVNQGFSGGEKKRNEILQMALLEPKIAILDETDSGLDIDALRIVASGIKKISNEQTGIILITHYQRLLDEIKPNYVHVMSDGQII